MMLLHHRFFDLFDGPFNFGFGARLIWISPLIFFVAFSVNGNGIIDLEKVVCL